jgi:hypothetical protein
MSGGAFGEISADFGKRSGGFRYGFRPPGHSFA